MTFWHRNPEIFSLQGHLCPSNLPKMNFAKIESELENLQWIPTSVY